MRKILTFLALPLPLTLLAASLIACNNDSAMTNRPIAITVLHTNDTHSHLEPFPRDHELTVSAAGPQEGGIARRKTLIDQTRAGEPQVLLLDAGDNFQGTIFYNAWKGSAEVMALNALGYDAVTLGNHEFDLGPVELGRALRGEPVTIAGAAYPTEKLQVPLIATNVDASREPALAGLFRASVVLERGSESFGILGIVTEEVPTASSPGPNLRFLDYVASVQAEADRLTEQGINKIILLSHYGYPVDVEKAPQLQGIDLIISGHDHALLGDPAAIEAVAPGQGARVKGPYPTVATARDGKPVLVVSAYEWGRWLGQLKVSFDDRGVVQSWQSQPIFVRGCEFANGAVDCRQQVVPEEPTVKAQVAAYREPVNRFAEVIIGQAGMVFDSNRVPGLRTQEMPLGNLVADVILQSAAQSDRAVAAIVNGGSIRAGLNPGNVSFENALGVLPFGNTVATLEVKGDTLVAALDHGLSKPTAGAFPQVAGLKLSYCAALPCAAALRTDGRVTRLLINGEPVDLAATYRIAANSFIAKGGDDYTMFKEACASGAYCRDTGILELDLLVDEFKARSPVLRSAEGRIVVGP
ncbi:MAG: 5'-nucleotidase/apyrase family protein [Candidatus Contendobacter sp.]|jgi:2',3'-cyclic-nucleotide 2'-phosphodiesterase (5'-nucleotidase family)|nr:5'-nucleotidase C-terminal domain-containing protein [Gammaproteobacteria bacterium]MCC8993868.1 5'-nucleotidase/apyrase family protein [Candidatus Contendobacter sp.]